MRLKNKTVFWGIILFVLLNILCFWKPDAVMAVEYSINSVDLYSDPKNILAESDFSIDCPREISVTYKDMEDEDIVIGYSYEGSHKNELKIEMFEFKSIEHPGHSYSYNGTDYIDIEENKIIMHLKDYLNEHVKDDSMRTIYIVINVSAYRNEEGQLVAPCVKTVIINVSGAPASWDKIEAQDVEYYEDCKLDIYDDQKLHTTHEINIYNDVIDDKCLPCDIYLKKIAGSEHLTLTEKGVCKVEKGTSAGIYKMKIAALIGADSFETAFAIRTAVVTVYLK